MIPKIKYLAAYRVAPISAITHIAAVQKIEQYRDTNKYILYFSDAPEDIKNVKLGKAKGKAPATLPGRKYWALIHWTMYSKFY